MSKRWSGSGLGGLVALALLAGCGSAPQTNTFALKAVEGRIAKAPPKTQWFLVWDRQAGGPTSHLLSVQNGEVIEVGTAHGAIMAFDQRAYRFVVEETEAPLYDCDFTTSTLPKSAEKATVHSGILEELGSHARTVIWAADDTSGENQLEDGVDIDASVGPYIFSSTNHWAYACGAHGSWNKASVVWDVRTQKPATLFSKEEQSSIDDNERMAARGLLLEPDSRDPEDIAPADVGLVAENIDYEKGRIGMSLHFATGACYACSDDEWSAYTRSAYVDAHTLPSALAPFAKPLPWLSAYRHQHADASISGVSEIDDPRKVPGLMDAMSPVEPLATK